MTSSSDQFFKAIGDAAVRESGEPCANFVFTYDDYLEWKLGEEMEEAARRRNEASASRPVSEPRVISKKRVRGTFAAPNSDDVRIVQFRAVSTNSTAPLFIFLGSHSPVINYGE
jgi:hypothetical protein